MMNKLTVILPFILIMSSCANNTTENKDSFGDEITEAESEFVEFNNPPAEGFNLEGSDMLATILADKCMQAMGGRKAWDKTRYISWNFLGRRKHLWDKATGNVRIEDPSNDLIVLMNIKNKEGSVFKDGGLVTDSLDHFLEKGYGWWVNDSYWLVMPYKLKDTGVTLSYVREDTTMNGDAADVIRLSFEDVGVSPENIYDVWVDIDSKLVTQWAFYPDSAAESPRFITEWRGYKSYGEILLSGNRGDYTITDINVHESIPEGIFTDYNVTLSAIN